MPIRFFLIALILYPTAYLDICPAYSLNSCLIVLFPFNEIFYEHVYLVDGFIFHDKFVYYFICIGLFTYRYSGV